MIQQKTRLDLYDNSWYKTGGGPLRKLLWYFLNQWVMNAGSIPFSGLRVGLLRLFGARVGKGVVIKPSVNIKYPWRLSIGDHCWIGEEVWIDNLAQVTIGDHVCISQGAMLLCGNHNYRKPTFDLMVKEIILENGAWVGAKSVVTPGVKMQEHAVLTAGSVAVSELQAWTIYQGNPALAVRKRVSDGF